MRRLRRDLLAALSVLVPALAWGCGRSQESQGAAAPSSRPAAAPAPAVEASDSPERARRPAGGRAPVIWLGLDGLDWELLDRLAREGRMPNWSLLVSKGYSARLKSFMPILSPVVWTTVATGVGPDVHRVLDFQEVDPATGEKVPISGRSRAVPAIWNVAAAEGRTVGVVGWWATHPAEEVTSFFVSDHASPILFEGLPRAGVAFPASLAAGVEQIVARDTPVSESELAGYLDVPATEIATGLASGKGLTNPVSALARIISATRVEQRIGRDLYDKNLPELMMLYLEGTDAIGHVFAPYVAPKMACVTDEDFRRYHRVVDEYYSLVDKMLGQWVRRADEDGATLIVSSDHGFKWGEDRPCERGSLAAATAAYWHRMDGVFLAYGKRVRRSAERGSASMFDMAPTLAALLELPVDRRLTGAPIRAAFTDLPAPARKDLFGSIPVRRLAEEKLSEKEASEFSQRLRSLGYLSGGEPARLEPTGGDRPGLTEGGWNNLGVYLRENTKDLADAESAFQKSLALRANYASPQFNLAVLYRMRGQDRLAVDWLFRSIAAGHADPEGTVLNWFAEYLDKGKKAEAREVLERGAQQMPSSETIARELGLQRFKSKDCPGAYEAVSRFESSTRDPTTINSLALFKTCLGRRDEAVALFHRSLSIQPNQPGVIQSLNLLQRGGPPGQ